jgi:hypothetical protein
LVIEYLLAKQEGQVTNTPVPTSRFAKNDAVRVRSGVKDPDFPDTPLGGWAGKIAEVEEGTPPTYLIRWNRKTLSSIHPVYRNRCERNGFDVEEMWLGENDLEPDSGGAVVLEQPTKIVTPPLSMNDQDDRIRAVFGLTRDDLLPEVDDTSLRTYYKFLAANLKLPFGATWEGESRVRQVPEKVTVYALSDFEDDSGTDETYGILCKAKLVDGKNELPLSELEMKDGSPNEQILDDYNYWFWNHR